VLLSVQLEAGSKQSPYVRVLDFAIRAAVLATTSKHVVDGRLLYRPDYCLLTYARELSLLSSCEVEKLNSWHDWEWNLPRLSLLCGEESVQDGKVDVKAVFGLIIKGIIRGSDHPRLSSEEVESMDLQLEDLENLQSSNFTSSFYNDYKTWQMRALEEYYLWISEVRHQITCVFLCIWEELLQGSLALKILHALLVDSTAQTDSRIVPCSGAGRRGTTASPHRQLLNVKLWSGTGLAALLMQSL
jgi:hypothetical protein